MAIENLTAEEWLTEIDNALVFREVYGKEAAWSKIEENYLNDPDSDTAVGENIIFSMGDAILSSLTVPDPEFVITAESPEGVSRAPIVERVDNWLVKKTRLKRHADMALLQGYLFGRPILKIGYDSEFGWAPFYDIGEVNNALGMTLTQFDKKGNRIEYMDITPGMPWVSWVAPQDFVVPWGTVFLDDAQWAAHRVVRLNSHIKADPKYSNKGRLEPDMSMESFMESYGYVGSRKIRDSYKRVNSDFTFKENKKALYNELWEIRDRRTGRIKVVARNFDKFLRDDPDALQVCGMPFVSSTFVQHPRSFWTTPLAYYLGQMQATSFDIALQAAKQRRISVLKFIAEKNAMSEEEMNKAVSGDVGTVALADTARPLRDIFIPFPQGNYLDFILEEDQNLKNARDTVGYGRNQLGEYDISTRRTAREATFVAMGAERRSSRRQQAVTDLYIETATKLNSLIFNFWKVPRFIMKDNGFVQFTGEELRGDYLYDVSLSTRRNLSRAERQIEAIMMLTRLIGLPGVNVPLLYKYLIDASIDPAFEGILGQSTGGRMPQEGALPTIPATGQGQMTGGQ